MKISLHSKNMLAIFGGDSLAKVLGFLVTAYLARTVGDVAFGSINIAMAALSYAIIVSTGGIPLFGTREIARNTLNIPQFTGELLTTRLLLSLIAMAVLM
ncbi:MAG: oligosaccharide flippase family protein, partial [Calditrichaeota bacterium]|nr:oligosaccharide flippase family protein [Calditrichota bacterium]